ncbi:MAG TPA: flagellar biosynthetic protein FliQ [Acidobacteria bacterium]|nr:flagellar biosynthetic protein FliQ [Acidobacteriota bacterium]
MDEMTVVAVGREAIKIALMVGLPVLLSGMVVGVLVSIFQVATGIQDMTITFIPKILIVFAVLAFGMHWMISVLTGFIERIFTLVSGVGI